jgi:hypothetical protein
VRNAGTSKRPCHYVHGDGAEGPGCVQTSNQAALWLDAEKMKKVRANVGNTGNSKERSKNKRNKNKNK